MKASSIGRAIAVVLALAHASTPWRAARAAEPSAVDLAARDRSRAAFVRGVEHAKKGRWSEARVSFTEAYALYPHASILLNLGIAELRAGDPVAAERDLVRFFSEDRDAPPDDLASAREALSEARAKIGSILVEARPAFARVFVDGKPVEVVRSSDADGASALVRVVPGRHVVRVEADGYPADERSVEAQASSQIRVVVALESSPEERPSEARAIVGWSLAGLATGALVTSGVTALRAASLSEDYRDPASARFRDPSTRDVGIGFRTAADVALAVGVASGVAAAVLLLTQPGSSKTARASDPLGLVRW